MRASAVGGAMAPGRAGAHDPAMTRAVRQFARVSEEQFLSLPESHDHVELVDGEVMLAPAPLPLHQLVVGNLFVVFREWARAHPPAFAGLSSLDVRLAAGRIVQPDLLLVLRGLPTVSRPVGRVPDLVVEVLSANRTYDRVTKRVLYAEAGVREYWIVDPDEATVEIIAGMASLETSGACVESRIAPGLRVDVASLFETPA